MIMTNVISVLVVLALVWTAAFFQLSIILWSALIAVGLLALSLFGFLTSITLIILWVCFLAVAAFANLSALRQRYVLKPFIKNLQQQMPAISLTERAAIEAGDTWWEKDLFCGRPDWNKLYNIPKPTLTLEEQSFLNNQVETLCSMLDDYDIVFKEHNLPPAVWDFLKREKFFGMVIPKQYGGLGFSALAHSSVVTKISSRSTSCAVTAMVPNSLGPGELLLHYGTDAQKEYYLPRLVSGLEMPCFALTGPDAGSDAGAIPDTAIVCKGEHEGKETIGLSLTWDKRYITLAPVATVLGLALHMYDPDKLLGDKVDLGITLCLIPTSHPGVEIGNRHFPMHLAFVNGPTRGKNVFIPLEWIIGGPEMAGHGWRMLMECLSIGRSISLPALATGASKITYRNTGAYSQVRRQFNSPISNFEGVQEALGYIAGYTYMLDACRIMTAGAVDLKINPSIVSAIAKYHMTESCRKVISHAMDVHGGHMIQEGPRNFLGNLYSAMPISITVEGANILTRNLIIFGQGAIRCHPYILKEVELLSAEQTNLEDLDRTIMSHIGFFAGNLLRSLAYGLTGGLFILVPGKNKRLKHAKRQLTRMSCALALFADASLILLGGSLKRRERISARLGDILSELYIASATLKYYHDNNRPSGDVPYVHWIMQMCLYKIQIAFNELITNFPNKFVGHLLGGIIFPWGPAYRHPTDKEHAAIIDPMLKTSELRERLAVNCYISKDESDLTCRLDKALAQIDEIELINKKMSKARKSHIIPHYYAFAEQVDAAVSANVISQAEATTLTAYEKLRSEIIKVNEFSFNLETVID